jgi:hypothetical protein
MARLAADYAIRPLEARDERAHRQELTVREWDGDHVKSCH